MNAISEAQKSGVTRTENLNLVGLIPLITPRALKNKLAASPSVLECVTKARMEISDIIAGKDKRMIVVTGPCSIHDPSEALEYAERLSKLRNELAEDLMVLMRVYFEKPRTVVGWKGLLSDPCLDGSSDIAYGLRTARNLLLKINAMGVPAAAEMLDPFVPQYTADLISWAAIGARTTESQIHRQMASGLSMPVGFKNSTDGNIQVAVDAMESARHPHSFLGIDDKGHVAIVRTRGNMSGHVILRGSASGPNYGARCVREACRRMSESSLTPAVMVDCSHGNSGKRYDAQERVWNNVLSQRLGGNGSIIGMLLESNLFEGGQKTAEYPGKLRYGVSITDECVSWNTTERLLRDAARLMRKCRPDMKTSRPPTAKKPVSESCTRELRKGKPTCL
jgi:3-deoxy-7-phosphoheptulonate synthase